MALTYWFKYCIIAVEIVCPKFKNHKSNEGLNPDGLGFFQWENLRCKNFTSSWDGSRYLPMAFTEQGIYMLMTVLRGELAVQ